MHLRRCLLLIAAVMVLGVRPPVAAAKNVLALFNLRPTNMAAMNDSGEILYALISSLEKAKGVEVMPRREMEEALFQAGQVQSDDPDLVAKAGRILGIDYVLFGTVTAEAGAVVSRLMLMDVQQGAVSREWQRRFASREAILSGIAGFADELVRVIVSRPMAPQGTAAAAAGPGIEALAAEAVEKAVNLSWQVTAGVPASGFHVYRAETAGGPYLFLGATDQPRYSDGAVTAGVTYHYRIGLLTAGGREVKDGRTASATFTGAPRPYPPLIMAATGQIRRATVKFVPSLQNEQAHFTIGAHRLYRRQGQAGAWTAVATIDSKQKSEFELAYTVVDAGPLEDGASYQYAVTGVDRSGRESPMSDPATVTVVDRPVLSVTGQDLLRAVDLGWTPLENVAGYRIYRRADDAKDWQRIGEVRGAENRAYTDHRDLLDGRSYHYRLTAYDDSGETAPSPEVAARTKDLPPPPGNLAAQGGQVRQVAISWTPLADPDVAGYAVYRGSDAEHLEPITKVRGVQSGGYLDKGSPFTPLADGTRYFYAVESYNRFDAAGPLTPVLEVVTKPRPAAVSGLTAEAGADHIALAWQPNPENDIQAYLIWRSRDGGGWAKLQQVDAGTRAFRDPDLKPGSMYRYRIVAEDRDGLQSDPIDSAAVSSPLAPAQ